MFRSLNYGCFAIVLAATTVLAQTSPQLSEPNLSPSAVNSSATRVFVTGRVLADDGSVVPSDAVIERVCGDRIAEKAYVDARGNFEFQMASNSGSNVSADSVRPLNNPDDMSPIDWNNCELRVNVVGYTSTKVSLAGKVAGSSQIDVGTLFVHRYAQDKFQTGQIAVTDLAAPEKAKKDFRKGEESARKSDWKSAEQNFQKAIDRYPQFAAAWAELARVQQQLGNTDAARQSFQRAIEVNPHMVEAYAGLSEIALQNRRWKDLEDSTDRLLAVNPDNLPQFWLLNAVAKFNLGQVDPAETSVLRGLRLDPQHRYPKMEHLFGVILAIKRQYGQAADHLKNYLRFAPKAPDASEVQVQLYKFEQLAQSVAPGK